LFETSKSEMGPQHGIAITASQIHNMYNQTITSNKFISNFKADTSKQKKSK